MKIEDLFQERKAVCFETMTFYVLGKSPVDRCECVDVGSVTG